MSFNDRTGTVRLFGNSNVTSNSATGSTADGGGILTVNTGPIAVVLSGSTVTLNKPNQCSPAVTAAEAYAATASAVARLGPIGCRGGLAQQV